MRPLGLRTGRVFFVSIRFRLLLLVLGTVFLPALLVGGRYFQDRSKEIDAAIAGLAATARTIAANFDAKIQGTIQLHFGLARAGDLSAGDKTACSNFLSEVREKNPQYTGILTITPDGGLFCNSLRTGRTLDLRDRKYFQQALKTDGMAVIEPVFGRLTGQAVLQIAYPARDEAKRLKFVLLASLDLSRLIRADPEPAARRRGRAGDRNGMILDWSPAQTRPDRRGTNIATSELFRLAAENPGGTRELRAAPMARPRCGPSPTRFRSAASICTSWSADPRRSLWRRRTGGSPRMPTARHRLGAAVRLRQPVRRIRHPRPDRAHRQNGRASRRRRSRRPGSATLSAAANSAA